ncbi:MAG: hypothetical protein IKP40_09655 [Clostridia bacterium]|nr:hypothetical protein [Clostridia bacterium]
MYETVCFGRYLQRETADEPIVWLILERFEDRLLLLSRDCLAVERFHFRESNKPWHHCNLRDWLREIFLSRAFTAEEASRILPTDIENSAHTHCIDPVFILSKEEIEQYFPTGRYLPFRERFADASPQADRLLRERGYIHETLTCSWWVRDDDRCGAKQTVVNRYGLFCAYRPTDMGTLVRPALWLNTGAAAADC